MTMLPLVAGFFRFGLVILLLVAGVWAYRRLRLPSIPWLLSYILLGGLLGIPATLAARLVIDAATTSGLPPIVSAIRAGPVEPIW